MWHNTVARLVVCIVFCIYMIGDTKSIKAQEFPHPNFQLGNRAVILGADTHLPLFSAPNSIVTRDHIRNGSLIVIADMVQQDDKTYYLVYGLTDRRRRGWVSIEVLHPTTEHNSYLGALQFCTRSISRLEHCGVHLSVQPGDAIYAQFDYSGVKDGDYLQWLVVVDGQQYTGAPIQLERTEGHLALNLLNLKTLPHRYAGNWNIIFIFQNGVQYEIPITLETITVDS